MPRQMPDLARGFSSEINAAVELTRAAEEARVFLTGFVDKRSLLHVGRIELLYELAFLRLFNAWEQFLEETFVRYLCGYQASHGQDMLATGTYYHTLTNARSAVLGGRDYVLWHNPQKVINRSRHWFVSARHELVIASTVGRLEYFAAIRHRIAHAQRHAKQQFDVATTGLIGRRYRGGRPGRFLRDWVPDASPPERWLARIGAELRGLAYQITP